MFCISTAPKFAVKNPHDQSIRTIVVHQNYCCPSELLLSIRTIVVHQNYCCAQCHYNCCVCVADPVVTVDAQFFLLLLLFLPHIPNFPAIFALAFPPWKQERSAWNCSTMCRLVPIYTPTFFHKSQSIVETLETFKISAPHPVDETSSRLAANAVTASKSISLT